VPQNVRWGAACPLQSRLAVVFLFLSEALRMASHTAAWRVRLLFIVIFSFASGVFHFRFRVAVPRASHLYLSTIRAAQA
jgi:hypothetical protein